MIDQPQNRRAGLRLGTFIEKEIEKRSQALEKGATRICAREFESTNLGLVEG